VISALFFLLAIVGTCWALFDSQTIGPYDDRGLSDSERRRQRAAEHAARSVLYERGSNVTPLGGDRPPTAYGTEHDGIGA
jgi:hypothetical protein